MLGAIPGIGHFNAEKNAAGRAHGGWNSKLPLAIVAGLEDLFGGVVMRPIGWNHIHTNTHRMSPVVVKPQRASKPCRTAEVDPVE
jgi:hypothetical protein